MKPRRKKDEVWMGGGKRKRHQKGNVEENSKEKSTEKRWNKRAAIEEDAPSEREASGVVVLTPKGEEKYEMSLLTESSICLPGLSACSGQEDLTRRRRQHGGIAGHIARAVAQDDSTSVLPLRWLL